MMRALTKFVCQCRGAWPPRRQAKMQGTGMTKRPLTIFTIFVLRRAGGKGTHSRAARSVLQYGKKLDGPRVGAIVIFYRKGPSNGHVGVVRGTDGQGNPIVVSGNHGPTVREATYPKSKVMAYVMPPNYVLEDMAETARQAATQ